LGFDQNKMKRKAIIISLSGKVLTSREENLIKKEKPWGIILFKRNIDSLRQVRKLSQKIHLATKDKNCFDSLFKPSQTKPIHSRKQLQNHN
jgi:beta-glucosidase-like glycosyl hydrolase